MLQYVSSLQLVNIQPKNIEFDYSTFFDLGGCSLKRKVGPIRRFNFIPIASFGGISGNADRHMRDYFSNGSGLAGTR